MSNHYSLRWTFSVIHLIVATFLVVGVSPYQFKPKAGASIDYVAQHWPPTAGQIAIAINFPAEATTTLLSRISIVGDRPLFRYRYVRCRILVFRSRFRIPPVCCGALVFHRARHRSVAAGGRAWQCYPAFQNIYCRRHRPFDCHHCSCVGIPSIRNSSISTDCPRWNDLGSFSDRSFCSAIATGAGGQTFTLTPGWPSFPRTLRKGPVAQVRAALFRANLGLPPAFINCRFPFRADPQK